MTPASGYPQVLAINSLPANGNAGLKTIMSLLGTRVIPVPTLLLSGIGNIPGYQKFTVPFAAHLEQTLTLARQRNERLIVYVGYLGEACQVDIISRLVNEYRSTIEQLVVDPVCGDNGKPYVPPEIIDAWPRLLALADVALPNVTEAALLSGYPAPLELAQPGRYAEAFTERFPQLLSIITGWAEAGQISNRLYQHGQVQHTSHAAYPVQLSGTGDAFASLFIYFHYFKQYPVGPAAEKAGLKVAEFVETSVRRGSRDLLVEWLQ